MELTVEDASEESPLCDWEHRRKRCQIPCICHEWLSFRSTSGSLQKKQRVTCHSQDIWCLKNNQLQHGLYHRSESRGLEILSSMSPLPQENCPRTPQTSFSCSLSLRPHYLMNHPLLHVFPGSIFFGVILEWVGALFFPPTMESKGMQPRGTTYSISSSVAPRIHNILQPFKYEDQIDPSRIFLAKLGQYMPSPTFCLEVRAKEVFV